MVFYSASKMMLLTEFFIKNRFFTLFLPRSFESCTYTHSPLGSFVPGILNNIKQIRQNVYSSYHQDPDVLTDMRGRCLYLGSHPGSIL